MSSDWIRKMKEDDERAESQENARLQKVVEGSMVVASGENEFFSQLVAAFESDAARMSEIGLFGHVTKQGSPDRYTSCHIGVELRGLNPNLTNTTIHHDPGSQKLRCLTAEGGHQQIHLDLVPHPKGGIGVAYGDRVLTAREFADITMKMMVKKVKPSRGTAA
ncbi:MAG TPA: hypothetical protein VMI10_12960 [Terriglobales bacterium]|nr:hypothetical protein [Terriglobales bacterium]